MVSLFACGQIYFASIRGSLFPLIRRPPTTAHTLPVSPSPPSSKLDCFRDSAVLNLIRSYVQVACQLGRRRRQSICFLFSTQLSRRIRRTSHLNGALLPPTRQAVSAGVCWCLLVFIAAFQHPNPSNERFLHHDDGHKRRGEMRSRSSH